MYKGVRIQDGASRSEEQELRPTVSIRRAQKLATENRDRPAGEYDPVAPARDSHEPASRGGLIADKLRSAPSIGPERSKGTMGGAGDGIFRNTERGGEEPRDEIGLGAVAGRGHDHSSNRPGRQSGEVGTEVPNLVGRAKFHQQIHPVRSDPEGRDSKDFRQVGRSGRLDGRAGGEVHLDGVRPSRARQEAAPGLEPGLVRNGHKPLLPEDVGGGQGGMAAEVDLDARA